MQVRMIQQEPNYYRVQRDGPSPAAQAQDALMQEFSAQIARLGAEMAAIGRKGAAMSAADRARLADLRQEMATVTGQLRELESQRRDDQLEQAIQSQVARGLGARAGVQVTPPRPEIPPEAVDISIAFFVCVAAAIILFPLMRSLGRILERRAAPPQRLDADTTSQLRRMEQAIDAVAIEVERIAEAQRYAAKLAVEKEKGALHG